MSATGATLFQLTKLVFVIAAAFADCTASSSCINKNLLRAGLFFVSKVRKSAAKTGSDIFMQYWSEKLEGYCLEQAVILLGHSASRGRAVE